MIQLSGVRRFVIDDCRFENEYFRLEVEGHTIVRVWSATSSMTFSDVMDDGDSTVLGS